MSNILDKLDSETRDVINYLKSREEVCDLNIEEVSGVTNSQLNDWENRNQCSLPQDLKNFYSIQNGLLIEWKCKISDDTKIPLGKIQINSLKDLTKVGSVLSKDYREPSIFDLEDLQVPPNMAQISSNSLANLNSLISNKAHSTSNHSNFVDELTESKLQEHFANSDDENDDIEEINLEDTHSNQTKILLPHFDDMSRNFELDNCNGFGKVCLVYRNAKPGMTCSDQSAEIWYLDRSLQWHYLTNSFKNYYRLLISHLGLPQWQMLFTEDGLPPCLNQWYYLFAPGRILIHQENWKKLEFLSLLEQNNPQNKKQPHHTANQGSNKKIDFTKLFEDKSKNKNNNSQPSSTAVSTQSNSNSDKSTNNNSKTKPKLNVNVRK